MKFKFNGDNEVVKNLEEGESILISYTPGQGFGIDGASPGVLVRLDGQGVVVEPVGLEGAELDGEAFVGQGYLEGDSKLACGDWQLRLVVKKVITGRELLEVYPGRKTGGEKPKLVIPRITPEVESEATMVMEESSEVKPRASMFDSKLLKGDHLGKYVIEREIGKGGMSSIYLAKNGENGGLVAIKVMSLENADEVVQKRFLQEAQLAMTLSEPHIVRVHEVEIEAEKGRSYFVMDFIDGKSLRDHLDSHVQVPEKEACLIVYHVAQALDVIAKQQIVHRDIKPDNIMFTLKGDVKLADLGIAKNQASDMGLTMQNHVMGTPAYLPPEQIASSKNVDSRSDIYSLGITLYEMLTGERPYDATTAPMTLKCIMETPVPDPREVNPKVSARVAALTMRMMAKEVDKRFQTPGELLAALTKILGTVNADASRQELSKLMASTPKPVDKAVAEGKTKKMLARTSRCKGKMMVEQAIEKTKKKGCAVFFLVLVVVGAFLWFLF